jgi:hypothetical protein
VKSAVTVLGRLGYLSEDRDLPPWMSVAELLRYTRAFYPRWDTNYAEELRCRFQLAPSARVRHLSKGELAKAGLLVALAHRPELLVLVPFTAGCAVVGCVVGAWMVLFHRLMPDLDFGHVLWVLLLGVAVMQTLAWILPRKPGQFADARAMVSRTAVLAVLPLEGDSWGQRRWVRTVVPPALPVLGLVAYAAARLNCSGSGRVKSPWAAPSWVFGSDGIAAVGHPPRRFLVRCRPRGGLLVTWVGFF